MACGFGGVAALVLILSGCGGSAVRERTGSGAGGASQAGSTASCEGVECEPGIPALCPDSTGYTPAGACCPVCAASTEPSCAGAECRAVGSCDEGYYFHRFVGACCSDCSRSNPSVCAGVSCEAEPCPRGYERAPPVLGCCYDCVPDPLYCETDDDCLMADVSDSCCKCPEPISWRLFRTDPCWIDVAAESAIPEYCEADFVCDGTCVGNCGVACPQSCMNPCHCEPPGIARCVSHHCTEVR